MPLDEIENVVVADQAGNGRSNDYLAASSHVSRWRERLETSQQNLVNIANDASRETGADRTRGVARALYLPLPDGALLWSQTDGLV